MNLPDRVTQGKVVINSSKVEQVERILAQHVSRLRVSLQHATGALSGPEEGSDAWLVLNALISSNDHPALLARFEQSGRALAEQGGKLETRIQGLQSYVDALAGECNEIFKDEEIGPRLLIGATARLYQLQSLCLSALTRWHQGLMHHALLPQHRLAKHYKHRLPARHLITHARKSTLDLKPSP